MLNTMTLINYAGMSPQHLCISVSSHRFPQYVCFSEPGQQ